MGGAGSSWMHWIRISHLLQRGRFRLPTSTIKDQAARVAKKIREPFTCPICGESVPGGAKSCSECGACEKSGWSGEADYDGVGLPDEDFNYDQFTAQEF